MQFRLCGMCLLQCEVLGLMFYINILKKKDGEREGNRLGFGYYQKSLSFIFKGMRVKREYWVFGDSDMIDMFLKLLKLFY